MYKNPSYSYASNLTPQQRRTFANRLLRLRDYLKTVKDSKYEHECLVSGVDPKHPCGTSACAMGHAVVSGKFPAMGLRVQGGFAGYDVSRGFYVDPDIIVSVRNGKAVKVNYHANKHFGPKAWQQIFDAGDNYDWEKQVTRTTVINRITQFVKERYGVTTIR